MTTLRFAIVAAALLAPVMAAAQNATFQRRDSVVGDAVEQTVQLKMRLETTTRQGAELIEEATSQVRRQQRRRVTARDTREGRVVAADVQFFEAASSHNGEAATDPVAGKTYRCVREGEQLRVTNAAGQMPPMAEYALVVRAMETLGTPSPLAEFLAGRTVAIGESLDLPADVAQRAIGFDKQLGTVDRFSLTLESVATVEGRRVASFAAQIDASGAGTQQMGLVIEGVFQVEEQTCRVVSADLAGPIAMSGLRGAGVAGYQLDGRGRMQLALAARYRDAVR